MPLLEGVVGSSKLLMLDGVPYQRETQWVIDNPCEEEMETESEDGDSDSGSESDSHSSPDRRRTQPSSPVVVTSQQKKKRRPATKLASGRKNLVGKPKREPMRSSKRVRQRQAMDEHMARMVRQPLTTTFVPSSSGTLQGETNLLRALQDTSETWDATGQQCFKCSSPPLSEMEILAIEERENFKEPLKVPVRRRSIKDASHGDSESDISVHGMSNRKKISGRYLLLGGPHRWEIQESMFHGRPWTPSSMQHAATVAIEKEDGKIKGGTTTSGSFQVYDYVPPNFKSEVFLNVKLLQNERQEKAMFITCEEKLKRQVYAILDALHNEMQTYA
jgi:hypothetical protein